MKKITLSIIVFLFMTALAYAELTAVIRGAVIRGAVIAPAVTAPPESCSEKNIGESCGGGIKAGLFREYGYVVTPGGCTDSSSPTCSGGGDVVTKAWANNSGITAYGVETGATSTVDGSDNMALLTANYEDTDAAKYCEDMHYGGFTDWFLPAQDELDFLYSNKALLGGFAASYYWSSTEADATNGRRQSFSDGNQSNGDKSGINYVRCARYYTRPR